MYIYIYISVCVCVCVCVCVGGWVGVCKRLLHLRGYIYKYKFATSSVTALLSIITLDF